MAGAKTILSIPGLWADHHELVQTIVDNSDGYLYAGKHLFEMATQKSFSLDMQPHDPQLLNAFSIAADFSLFKETLPPETLQQIEKHTHVLYLKSTVSTRGDLLNLVKAGMGLLKAGGLAVRVESTGVAHSTERWQALAADNGKNMRDLFFGFVTFVVNEQDMYSVGMHHFGKREARIRGFGDAKKAHLTLGNFLLYNIIENPTFEDGHTFSLSPTDPMYRLKAGECDTYPPDNLSHNPFGMWTLSEVKPPPMI